MGVIPQFYWHAVRAMLAVAGLMACNPVLAADQALPPVAPPSSWTGFYVGGSAGYGWGSRSNFNLTGLNGAGRAILDPAASPFVPPTVAVPSGSFRTEGAFAGLQGGYNLQFARNWVAGIETDFSMSSIAGRDEIGNVRVGFNDFFKTSGSSDLEWFGTLRGRLGVLPWDNLLIYATGGLAYGRVKTASVIFVTGGLGIGGLPDATTIACSGSPCLAGSASRTSTGWTAGGGIEYALSPTWSIKAEYLHIDLDFRQSFVMQVQAPNTGNALASAVFSDYSIDIVRVGMNYKFFPR